MNNDNEREPEYLGDGVYASFDGYHVWLRTGSHDNPEAIALEPEVWNALVRYRERVTKTADLRPSRVFCDFEDCDGEPDSTGLCETHRREFREHQAVKP